MFQTLNHTQAALSPHSARRVPQGHRRPCACFFITIFRKWGGIEAHTTHDTKTFGNTKLLRISLEFLHLSREMGHREQQHRNIQSILEREVIQYYSFFVCCPFTFSFLYRDESDGLPDPPQSSILGPR